MARIARKPGNQKGCMNQLKRKADARKILDGLFREKFARWYEKEFIPNYLEESNLTEDEVLVKIVELFRI